MKDTYYPVVMAELRNSFHLKEICSLFMVRNEQEKKPSYHKNRQKLLSCGQRVCRAKSLAIGMAVLVLKATMVC